MSKLTHNSAASGSVQFEWADRRREPRFGATGNVNVVVPRPEGKLSFSGELLDISRSGFHLRHACAELYRGERVRVMLASGEVEAEVVWNSVHGKSVETGLCLVPKNK